MKTFQNLKCCSLRTLQKALCMLALLTLFASSAFALQDGAARTPPMGFNTWNYFGCPNNNQANVLAVAASMLKTHPANWEGKTLSLQSAGYKYINLDDCWESGSTRSGALTDTLKWDATRFPHPNGLIWLAETLHTLGFKFGIYSCCGTQTCALRPGSYNYEATDAYTFVKWGIDYLKEDWCSVPSTYTSGNGGAATLYSRMGRGIDSAQKKLGIKSTFIFSLCNWGQQSPWLFGDTCGHLWRTTGDIVATWVGNGSAGGVQANFLTSYNESWQYSGPGKWNDPDMLEVGNGLANNTQDRAHFDLWCIAAAPLIMGNNTPVMTDSTFTILSNREVIAVDQDSLGKQGHRVAGSGSGVDVYVKVMKSKDTTAQRIAAVCVVNWGNASASGQTITWANLGEKNTSQTYTVRDLHTHANLTTNVSGSYTTAAVPGTGTQMLLFTSNAAVEIRDQVGLTGPMNTGKLLTRVNANVLECYVPHANSIVQVFSLSGKEVSAFSAPEANWYKVNGHMLPGTYILRVTGNNSAIEGKVSLFSK